jgi:uncharacterized protein involved in exopolysaccharide biosynthesis
VGFTARCVGRNRSLALLVATGFATAAVAALPLLPKTWQVTSRIHAAPLETSPGATRPSGGGPVGLTLPAVEAALSHSWLERTARELRLLERRDQNRVWISRFKQRVLDTLFSATELSLAQRESMLAEDLREQLRITLQADSVSLELSWWDRESAVELLRRAQERLLAFRREVELAPLEARERSAALALDAARAELDISLAKAEALLAAKRKGAKPSTVRGVQAQGRWGDMPDQQLAGLRQKILRVRGLIAQEEKSHLERLAELNATLVEQRAVYTPEHPLLMESEGKLRELKGRERSTNELRDQERALVAEYVRLGGRSGELSEAEVPLWPEELARDDQALALQQARVSRELDRVAQLQSEFTNARAQLDAERAALGQRYVVVAPVRPPRNPAFPQLSSFLVAALVGGFLLAIFSAVARDLWRGRVVESWQVSRVTGLQLLGEVQR